jgi:chromosome segregation ATPase
MTDIVERLQMRRDPLTDGERAEAADEIERLRAERDVWVNGFVKEAYPNRDMEIERLRDLVADLANDKVENLDKIVALEAAIDRLRATRDRAEVEIERLRENVEEAARLNLAVMKESELFFREAERLRELLRDARDDVAEIAAQQTKRHRIEEYREQLAAIDEALGEGAEKIVTTGANGS